MDERIAVSGLAALAQRHRLRLFRLLVRRGAGGMPAGEIAQALGLAPSALSFHLKELCSAGLLRSRQEGRYVIYRADFMQMNALLNFLTENCCADGAAVDGVCAAPLGCGEHRE